MEVSNYLEKEVTRKEMHKVCYIHICYMIKTLRKDKSEGNEIGYPLK